MNAPVVFCTPSSPITRRAAESLSLRSSFSLRDRQRGPHTRTKNNDPPTPLAAAAHKTQNQRSLFLLALSRALPLTLVSLQRTTRMKSDSSLSKRARCTKQGRSSRGAAEAATAAAASVRNDESLQSGRGNNLDFAACNNSSNASEHGDQPTFRQAHPPSIVRDAAEAQAERSSSQGAAVLSHSHDTARALRV